MKEEITRSIRIESWLNKALLTLSERSKRSVNSEIEMALEEWAIANGFTREGREGETPCKQP